MVGFSYKTVASYTRGVISHLRMSGVDLPQSNFLLSRVLRGVKSRPLRWRVQLPVSRPLLTSLVAAAEITLKGFNKVAIIAIMTLAFHALLRIGECCDSPHAITMERINFFVPPGEDPSSPQLAILRFGTTKTDQTGEKNQWTWITPDPPVCPIASLLQFIRIRPSASCSNLFVNSSGKPWTCQVFSKMFGSLLQTVGKDPDEVKAHSLRIGGAAHLFMSGWDMAQIKAKGRWASDSVAKHYFMQQFF